jgi:hypothetical protein
VPPAQAEPRVRVLGDHLSKVLRYSPSAVVVYEEGPPDHAIECCRSLRTVAQELPQRARMQHD